jgi:hypothetical protein
MLHCSTLDWCLDTVRCHWTGVWTLSAVQWALVVLYDAKKMPDFDITSVRLTVIRYQCLNLLSEFHEILCMNYESPQTSVIFVKTGSIEATLHWHKWMSTHMLHMS